MKARIARIKAAEILGFNSDNHYLSKSWPELLAAKAITKLQGDSEISLNLIKNAIDDGVIHQQYKDTDHIAASNPTISASDFIALLKEIDKEPSEHIKAWYESTTPQTEAAGDAGTTKPREGRYKPRDEFAIQQVKDRPELLEMRAGMIETELKEASNLFTSGYDSWWRKNPVFNKSEPGRNPK